MPRRFAPLLIGGPCFLHRNVASAAVVKRRLQALILKHSSIPQWTRTLGRAPHTCRAGTRRVPTIAGLFGTRIADGLARNRVLPTTSGFAALTSRYPALKPVGLRAAPSDGPHGPPPRPVNFYWASLRISRGVGHERVDIHSESQVPIRASIHGEAAI